MHDIAMAALPVFLMQSVVIRHLRTAKWEAHVMSDYAALIRPARLAQREMALHSGRDRPHRAYRIRCRIPSRASSEL